MALDIVKLYVSLLSEFFCLSDAVVMQRNNSDSPPKLLPRHSNSLTTAHFLIKILIEIQDCASEVTGMDIVPEATSNLRNLVDSTRWKFGDILVRAWLRGCHLDLSSHMLLTNAINRRQSIPPPRNVDTLYARSFCDTVYVFAGCVPETYDHDCIETRWRHRVIVDYVFVPDHTAEPNLPCVYGKDHKSIPRRSVCIFRRLGSPYFIRVVHNNGDFWFESVIATKTI